MEYNFKERLDEYLTKINKFNYSNEIKERLIANFKNNDKFYFDLTKYNFPDRLDFDFDHKYYQAISLPYSEEIVDFMLNNILCINNPLIIISLLNHGKVKYDGTVLMSIYGHLDNKLKWQFCDLISENIPLNINDWLIKLYLDKENGDETLLLAEVIPIILDEEQALEVLKQGFDHKPSITAAVIGRIDKKATTLDFLREKLKIFSDKSKLPYKEIVKSIKKIEKRLLKNK